MNYQNRLFELAVENLENESIRQYMEIRSLLENQPDEWEREFRTKFSKYYRLRLSSEKREEYFKLLFSFKIEEENIKSQYRELLEHLYYSPHGEERKRLECSFVSKLVAIHDEQWPIFDIHVSNYFGLFIPRTTSIEMRIDVFTSHIIYLRQSYEMLTNKPDVKSSLDRLIEKHSILEKCHNYRKIDFLIWTIGRKELWNKC